MPSYIFFLWTHWIIFHFTRMYKGETFHIKLNKFGQIVIHPSIIFSGNWAWEEISGGSWKEQRSITTAQKGRYFRGGEKSRGNKMGRISKSKILSTLFPRLSISYFLSFLLRALLSKERTIFSAYVLRHFLFYLFK